MGTQQRGRPGRRRAASRSLVKRRGELYYQNFSVHGRRFRECLGTSDPVKAEALALEAKSQALLAGPAAATQVRGKAEITLDEALARYCVEIGQYAKTADDIERHGKALLAGLGGDTRLGKLDFSALSHYIATRRVRKVRNAATGKYELRDRANGSINREIGHLRTVMLAAERWGHKVAKIEWRHLFLDEPDNVQTILSEAQEDRLFAELRPDFHGFIAFALISGVRRENVVNLRWSQIDEVARTITFRVKSKKPGGALHVLPLTPMLLAILGVERGRHPEYVFTYVCAKNRHEPHAGVVQVRGMRYPFTYHGWVREWDRARRAAGVPELRFHDLRHTAATRALRAHGNLKAVSRMLGHSNIETTLRYAATDVDDVRAVMEAAEALFRHKKWHKRQSGGGNV